ncbi:phage tail protein [Pseudomonas sp. PA15(2017)]|uniref:phage tail protein n=1 Tax=Pseudomonas sp. PA15(2017) TaxID=1932111 RepID=UPI0009662C8F|nr:phage tail protein [Pseudomonas sp. PA15(2017)]OLU22474.1 phage tail protein [Pseudomonas sp. PA15(2017)]
MKKPNSLRAHLLASIPALRQNPDRLLVFVDNGHIRATSAPGLSFTYDYQLNVILTDFPGSPDAVSVPLLAWLLVNQADLLTNLEKGKDAIGFDVDVLDAGSVDLSLTLPLSERIIVKRQSNGTLHIEHPDEPPLTPHLPQATVQLIGDGQVLAEFASGEPVGVDIETPHPMPRRGR